jgi:hypothetical protein
MCKFYPDYSSSVQVTNSAPVLGVCTNRPVGICPTRRICCGVGRQAGQLSGRVIQSVCSMVHGSVVSSSKPIRHMAAHLVTRPSPPHLAAALSLVLSSSVMAAEFAVSSQSPKRYSRLHLPFMHDSTIYGETTMGAFEQRYITLSTPARGPRHGQPCCPTFDHFTNHISFFF